MTLLQRVFGFDPKYGGRQIAMIGEQGTRKTTILRAYAETALAEKTPVIWRGRRFRDQWHLIPAESTVLVPDTSPVLFWEIPQGTIDRSEVKPEVQVYSTGEELLSLINQGLNVVVEPNLPSPWLAVWWVHFLTLLAHREENPSIRKYPRMRLCFDEILDVFPSSTGGKTDAFNLIMPYLNRKFYDFRRSGTDMMFVGHASGDIHYEIRKAFTGIMYLPGAGSIEGRRVGKKVLRGLKTGHAIVELRDIFFDLAISLPASRQPTSYISYTRSEDYWTPDEAFKRAALEILENRRDLIRRYRLWEEPRKVKAEKRVPPDGQNREGGPPINLFKTEGKKGKKTAHPAKRGG